MKRLQIVPLINDADWPAGVSWAPRSKQTFTQDKLCTDANAQHAERRCLGGTGWSNMWLWSGRGQGWRNEGGVAVKGGALSFKCRLKASEAAVTLDLKVSAWVSQTGVRTAVIEEFPAAGRRGEARWGGGGREMDEERGEGTVETLWVGLRPPWQPAHRGRGEGAFLHSNGAIWHTVMEISPSADQF